MSSYTTNHSSDVDLQLIIGGQSLELARVSPNSCSLRHSAEFPAGEAELLIIIDGHERRQQVYLPEGISSASREVKYTTHETAPAQA